MSADLSGGGKLPGKTKYAGRRRAMTRSSGFKVHPETTGGEFKRQSVTTHKLNAGESVTISFRISGHRAGDLIGYGAWFWCTSAVVVSINGGPQKRTLTEYGGDSWNKVGSIWNATDDATVTVTINFTAQKRSEIALYAPLCGRIQHKHLDKARQALLLNMFEISPEAIFVDGKIDASMEIVAPKSNGTGSHPLLLKSCNRCGRYLPINFPSERNHLSFTNHCVADHRSPC